MYLYVSIENKFLNKNKKKKHIQNKGIRTFWYSFNKLVKFFKIGKFINFSGENIAATNGITAAILIISNIDKIRKRNIIKKNFFWFLLDIIDQAEVYRFTIC
tara:strand:- start:28517 stop:28822 length:306 start_codon:yes stop_codon:yes gene_type:complete